MCQKTAYLSRHRHRMVNLLLEKINYTNQNIVTVALLEEACFLDDRRIFWTLDMKINSIKNWGWWLRVPKRNEWFGSFFMIYSLDLDLTYSSNLKARFQSSVGFLSQLVKTAGRACLKYLFIICFSRKPVVDSRERLSAVVLSQSEHLGTCSRWTTLPRNAEIKWRALIKIEALTSFFTYRFW